MIRPAIWNEEMLLALESKGEHDFQEFKSAPYMAVDKKIAPDFIQSVSKQISAFANGAGGQLFIGVDDNGHIDGGVRTDLKPCGTRSWLEDVLPGTIDPPLSKFNVFEVTGGPGSLILPEHAVYVIDIAASEDAPHQALDYRYYLRIAGKSRPMGNVHIQDVLQRTRHPRVEVKRISPYGDADYFERDPRGPKMTIGFQAIVSNLGQNLAHHVGLELILPRPLVDATARSRMLSQPDVSLTQRPSEIAFFRYHPYPLFPGQELVFMRFWLTAHAKNMRDLSDQSMQIGWRLYADDARPNEGAIPVSQFKVMREAEQRFRPKTTSQPAPINPEMGGNKPYKPARLAKAQEVASQKSKESTNTAAKIPHK